EIGFPPDPFEQQRRAAFAETVSGRAAEFSVERFVAHPAGRPVEKAIVSFGELLPASRFDLFQTPSAKLIELLDGPLHTRKCDLSRQALRKRLSGYRRSLLFERVCCCIYRSY